MRLTLPLFACALLLLAAWRTESAVALILGVLGLVAIAQAAEAREDASQDISQRFRLKSGRTLYLDRIDRIDRDGGS